MKFAHIFLCIIALILLVSVCSCQKKNNGDNEKNNQKLSEEKSDTDKNDIEKDKKFQQKENLFGKNGILLLGYESVNEDSIISNILKEKETYRGAYYDNNSLFIYSFNNRGKILNTHTIDFSVDIQPSENLKYEKIGSNYFITSDSFIICQSSDGSINYDFAENGILTLKKKIIYFWKESDQYKILAYDYKSKKVSIINVNMDGKPKGLLKRYDEDVIEGFILSIENYTKNINVIKREDHLLLLSFKSFIVKIIQIDLVNLNTKESKTSYNYERLIPFDDYGIETELLKVYDLGNDLLLAGSYYEVWPDFGGQRNDFFWSAKIKNLKKFDYSHGTEGLVVFDCKSNERNINNGFMILDSIITPRGEYITLKKRAMSLSSDDNYYLDIFSSSDDFKSINTKTVKIDEYMIINDSVPIITHNLEGVLIPTVVKSEERSEAAVLRVLYTP